VLSGMEFEMKLLRTELLMAKSYGMLPCMISLWSCESCSVHSHTCTELGLGLNEHEWWSVTLRGKEAIEASIEQARMEKGRR
jgi:hypothetical protein